MYVCERTPVHSLLHNIVPVASSYLYFGPPIRDVFFPPIKYENKRVNIKWWILFVSTIVCSLGCSFEKHQIEPNEKKICFNEHDIRSSFCQHSFHHICKKKKTACQPTTIYQIKYLKEQYRLRLAS